MSKSSKKNNAKRPPPQEVKSKARTAPEQLKKTKKRQYTEEELDLPKLNTITPVGVVKPKGKKKGKTFIDDQVGSTCHNPGFYFLCYFEIFLLISWVFYFIGRYDDYSCHGECRAGGPDRVEDDEGPAIRRDSGSKKKGSRGETGAEEVQIGT